MGLGQGKSRGDMHHVEGMGEVVSNKQRSSQPVVKPGTLFGM